MTIRKVLSLLVVSVFALSCTKKKQGTESLNLKETLRINITTEPPTLDWNKSTDTTSAMIQDNIMEGLVEYNFNDPELSLRGALATKWTATNKAQNWSFDIRSGVTWNDGVPLTAQQFVDGWERLLNPMTASEYAYFLYGVKNARKYNEGELKDFSQVGVKAVGNRLEVELTGPQSYFPYLLTHHSTYPVRKELIEKHGDSWTSPENIVTLGAFNLKEWQHDKSITLERNEIYYGEKAKLKYVLAYMISDMHTAINLIDKGKLDAQMGLPSTELPILKKRKDFKENNVLSLYYYGFNVKKAPMDNALVRKAISHAINRDEITGMLAGGQVPLTSWVPPGMFGHEPKVGTSFDTKKANALLDKAGYKDRTKFPKLSLSFNTNDNHQRIAENVQAQLKKNLGVTIELQNEEWKVYLSTIKTNPPHIYRMGWLADFPDPDNFLNLMTSYSDNNHTNWGNKDFDTLIEKAASELNKDKRRNYYSKAQQILTELDVPVAPIFAAVSHRLVSPRVQNFPQNSMGRFQYKEVTLK